MILFTYYLTSMVSEENKGDSKEEKTSAFSFSNGPAPMIHVSTDVLKEFICSVPQQAKEKKIGLPAKKVDPLNFDVPNIKLGSKRFPAAISSKDIPHSNGILSSSGRDTSGKHKDSAKPNGLLSSLKQPPPSTNVSVSSSESSDTPTSENNLVACKSETLADSSLKESLPTTDCQPSLSAIGKQASKSSPFETSMKTPTSPSVPPTLPESESTESSSFEKSKNSTEPEEERSACYKSTTESLQEELQDYQLEDDPQPGTPLSETLSQISLEETLLRDDMNVDQEIDELAEKLLQTTTIENDRSTREGAGVNTDAHSHETHSLLLFNDINDSGSKENESTSSSSQGNKDIAKILQDLDSSIGGPKRSHSLLGSNSQKDSKEVDKNSEDGSSSSHSRGEASSKRRSLDNSAVKDIGAGSLPVPENLENNLSGHKRSLPADFKGDAMDSVAPCKMLRKDSKTSDMAREKLETSQSFSVSKDNALTFREALKSIAKEDQLRSADIARPLIPTTEILSPDIASSSLTILQPSSSSETYASGTTTASLSNSDTAATQVKKKLGQAEQSTGSKPDLKKVRVFKGINNHNKKENVDCVVRNINHGLVEISENVRELDCRLQKKVLHNKNSNSEKPITRSNDAFISKEELERRAAQEVRNANLGNNKLRRIKRKDLESLVIELFVDKVLYEHQLGQQKDLCKRLEATLEANRKKAAQFHKEVDDLKKVTQRLQAEHAVRKNQIVGPVRVKRSVGIQATPTIIGKGIMQASTANTSTNANTNFRILTPSMPPSSSSPSSESAKEQKSSQTSQVRHSDEPVIITPSQAKALTHQSPPPKSFHPLCAQPSTESAAPVHTLVKTSTVTAQCVVQQAGTAPGPATQMVVVNPVVVQQQQHQQQPQSSQSGVVASPILPAGTTRLIRTPLSSVPSSTLSHTASPLPSSQLHSVGGPSRTASGVIDLTDDEEGAKASRAAVPTGSVLTFQRSPGVSIAQNTSGQFVALKPPSSVGQLVLVPTSLGQPTTALVVGSVANSTQTLSTIGTTVKPKVIATTTTAATRLPSPTTIVNTTRVVVGTHVNGSNFIASISRHPAPLPKAPPQQTTGNLKKLPPMPILKLSQKDNSIVLSWNMAKTDEHERIASYQLYAYQEGLAPPTPTLWKKVGSVKALELPMACTLTQFMPGHVYHFAVRAVDIRSRLGPFSEPRSVRLGKQTQ